MYDPAAGPSVSANHELIVQLLNDALAALEVDCAKARRDILHARALAFEPSQPAPPQAGGLTGWQMRRVANFVHFNLSTRLRIEQVAGALKVSPGYLSRAFKATAGVTYSDFVTHARVELAKRLLLTTDTPISEIALACGLTDQSHLTRLFKRSVGSPPAAWRRRFRDGAEVDSIDTRHLRQGEVVPFPGGEGARHRPAASTAPAISAHRGGRRPHRLAAPKTTDG